MSSNENNEIDVSSKNKIALKLLVGGVPNVALQLGVCSILREWGFEISVGWLNEGESRQCGNRILNPIIGSSALSTLNL